MKLSIIIVSYNVYPFLDNCLRSAKQALRGIPGEIIVVDNASIDRSPQLVQEHFPDVTVIANATNPGFSIANNQGIAISKGEFILLLNPDTILSEDTLTTCLSFMEKHPEAGAIGVKMIDGSGRYLPESKRGLPTLSASFMKMTGLYKLNPTSAKWNQYYMGHIGENETALIEVLTGAFMFMRKEALQKAGWLDEAFFMYGEDIDLSYRIRKNGYNIYYLPTTSIIHYKGESTKKSTVQYIRKFYEAMLIFTRKHPEFKGQQGLIQTAIYFHGFLQFVRQSIRKMKPVLLDTMIIYLMFMLSAWFWSGTYYKRTDYFPVSFYTINIPLYILLFIISFFFQGVYDSGTKFRNRWTGFFTGVILVLIVYALLPLELRYSRMVIILGSALSFAAMAFWHYLKRDKRYDEGGRKTLIIADKQEASRIKELINRSHERIDVLGVVSPSIQNDSNEFVGHIDQLADIVRIRGVEEIIFSSRDVSFSTFTRAMAQLGPGLRYMMAASTTENIVGSMHKDAEGELYGMQIVFLIATPAGRRAKRITAIISSLVLLLTFPLWCLLVKRSGAAFINLWRVLTGRMELVSYHPVDQRLDTLPPLNKGILYPGYPEDNDKGRKKLSHINFIYARDYHWSTDLSILGTQFRKLGQNLNYEA